MPGESEYAKMIAENRQFTVVTRVTPVREGGRIVVHAYGPYNRRRAQSVQQRIKRDAVREGWAHRLEVSCCTLLADEPGTVVSDGSDAVGDGSGS